VATRAPSNLGLYAGYSDDEAQEAIQAAGYRLKRAGNPPHSVSLIYGWGQE
jgi:hypothetical protein